MPLVRVGGTDFEVAEMTDSQFAQRNSWMSLPPQSAGVGPFGAQILSPMPEIDDSTSTISSSRRTLEGIGSIVIYTDSNNGTASSDRLPSRSSFSSKQLCEAVERNCEMHHGPRNSFETSRIGQHFIQESDETSLSTMDDSFVSPCLAQQTGHHSTQQSRFHTQQKSLPRSYRNRQKHQLSIPDQVDDVVSVPSIPSNLRSSKDNAIRPKSPQSIAALESLVEKLSFELATTKSSLDELRLENRNLQHDKTTLSASLTNMQKENDRLRVHIVRLEKEKILRNIEGTKGVAQTNVDSGLCLEWSEMSVGDNKGTKTSDAASAASSNRVSVPTFYFENNGAVQSGMKYRTSSYEPANDLVGSDVDSDCDDAASVKFGGSVGSLDRSNNNEQDKKIGKGGLNLLNMIGGGKIQSVRDIVSSHVIKNHIMEADSKLTDKKLTSNQTSSRGNATAHNGCRRNAQIIDDDCNYDDPFETWSAPGDVKRNEQQHNWLQRGFGGRRKDTKH